MEYFNEDELYKYFKGEINKLSSAKINSLREEIRAIKTKEIKKLESELKEDMKATLGVELKEIYSKYRTEVNKIVNETSYKLMKRREELLNSVFTSVKGKIAEYVKSSQYEELMKTKMMKLNDLFVKEKVVFKVKNNDQIIEKVIKSTFLGEYEVEVNPDIELGGFQAYMSNKGVEIDETIDTKLKEKRQWFYANSKLFIQY